jgi:hypothetical protein
MTEAHRQLLQRLADAGKPTTLDADELVLAQALASEALLFYDQGYCGRDHHAERQACACKP